MIREFEPSESTLDTEAEKRKQYDRERCAFQSVFLHGSRTSSSSSSPVAHIKLFTSKTKACLTEDYEPAGNKIKCTFKYHSILRAIIAEAEASSKKLAKNDCAALLLGFLKEQTRPS